MSDPNRESSQAAKARRGRNIATALALAAFVVLVFIISIAKMSAHAATPSSPAARNARVATICAAVFLAMVGAAFAAVPLYRAFCQATGFNGAVRRASAPPRAVSDKTIVVRFDTNVRGLAWRFEPVQPQQTVHLGEAKLAFFRATNIGDAPLTGRALYNVLPETAGPYFSKLECFCFKNQTLKPGETLEFPVVYTVDPRFATDRDNASFSQITLSYTFFPAVAKEPESAGSTPG